MAHELTIRVDDVVYAHLKSMVEQDTIGEFLSAALQGSGNCPAPDIKRLRGTLYSVTTDDIRDEEDRNL